MAGGLFVLPKMHKITQNSLLKKHGIFCLTFSKDAVEEKEYIVRQIDTDDEELKTFLFSLGCYEGEPITVVSHLKDSCVVSIKDGRYNIDNQLADAILI